MSGMTKERIAELRALATCSCAHCRAFVEAADEIERLQAIKPAPSREQVRMVFKGPKYHRSWGPLVMKALSAAGLLAEPERAPGWYLVRDKGSLTWVAAEIINATTLRISGYEGSNGIEGFEIGARIEPPND